MDVVETLIVSLNLRDRMGVTGVRRRVTRPRATPCWGVRRPPRVGKVTGAKYLRAMPETIRRAVTQNCLQG